MAFPEWAPIAGGGKPYGSIRKITYSYKNVKVQNFNNLTTVQLALQKAGVIVGFTGAGNMVFYGIIDFAFELKNKKTKADTQAAMLYAGSHRNSVSANNRLSQKPSIVNIKYTQRSYQVEVDFSPQKTHTCLF